MEALQSGLRVRDQSLPGPMGSDGHSNLHRVLHDEPVMHKPFHFVAVGFVVINLIDTDCPATGRHVEDEGIRTLRHAYLAGLGRP
jgi:hypothetical protein